MAYKSKILSSIFFLSEVLILVPLAHALYSAADDYWPLDEISYSRIYNWRNWNWKARVKGDAEITWSPPRLSLDLYGDNAWLDLGWRNGSCYIDVALCNQAGLTVAFWVALRESDTRQGLVEFGSGACGLSLIRTQDGEINATIRSLGLKKIWSVSSVKASVGKDVWHHVTLTFNSTGEVHLYINGTRLDDARADVLSNVTCPNASCNCDWSMKVGTITRGDFRNHSYSSLKVASLALWQYALNEKTILELSNDVRGLHFSHKGCSYPWTANLQFCYHIHPLKETWYDAKKRCDSYLASLASVGSQEENDFLEHEFKKAKVSSCLHIGLRGHTGGSQPSWLDGNVWSFSKLNSSHQQSNETQTCAHRGVDGLWYLGNCSKMCGFVCKKYRSGLFRNAEFHCRARSYNHRLVNHRFSIHWVRNELNCAVECLIYGSICKSYNYEQEQNICELNDSNLQTQIASLRYSIGYKYCERTS
ncbi:uncharacterized protein LOC114975897 [Acropora millepora]|uniref:uncharacterized protein LOC114975897 n=1 Tax=Acropora millepora TaxID=45264 RepID=UPI001CF2464B|nr:uncharacterized protein LOC114975897 [Acropora millepora]